MLWAPSTLSDRLSAERLSAGCFAVSDRAPTFIVNLMIDRVNVTQHRVAVQRDARAWNGRSVTARPSSHRPSVSL